MSRDGGLGGEDTCLLKSRLRPPNDRRAADQPESRCELIIQEQHTGFLNPSSVLPPLEFPTAVCLALNIMFCD